MHIQGGGKGKEDGTADQQVGPNADEPPAARMLDDKMDDTILVNHPAADDIFDLFGDHSVSKKNANQNVYYGTVQ